MRRKPFLVGLAGPAGVGKNTVADLLESKRLHYSFAGPLKAMLAAIELYEPSNRADKEKLIPSLGFSWRQAAQTLGTEWGRALHPELWLLLAKREREMRAGLGHEFMILTDVRFENEAQWIRENGTLVHVFGRKADLGDRAGHISENELFVYAEDLKLYNGGDLRALKTAVEDLGSELRQRRGKAVCGAA